MKIEVTSPPSSTFRKDGIPARYILTFLAFFGFVLTYMLRINMSIALVAMVKRNDSTSEHSENGEFYWDDRAQSLINGAFFWGYIFTQVPGGRLAEMFGPKYIFGFSIFLSGIVTLLIPFAASENPLKLICLRMMLGLLQGVTYPSMHVFIAKWIPASERSKITSIIYTGAQAGTVITLPLIGQTISMFGGWRPSFYLMGALSSIWMIFVLIFVYDSPQSHPRIDTNELKYLTANIPAPAPASAKTVPWIKIFTCHPFLAAVIASMSTSWGFWTLLTYLPTYMNTMLHYDIKQNSFLSAIPYLAMWIFAVVYAILADWLGNSGILSTQNVRKLSAIICLALPAFAIFGVTQIGTNPVATLVLFTFAVGMTGAHLCVYHCSLFDLAPNYAGTLFGILNAANTIPGWLSPLVASSIIDNHQTLDNWHTVFYITSGIYLFGCVYYLLFGSAQLQPWNDSNNCESLKNSNLAELQLNNK